MLTYRLVHHNPSLGFVVTGTVQHMLYDDVSIEARSDSLAFEGYLTRDGQRVEVPVADRGLPEYADLRQVSRGTGAHRRSAPADWIMAVQATKTLAANGRVTFWAYNLFDHIGYFGEPDRRPRSYPGMRFGLEVMLPAEVFPW